MELTFSAFCMRCGAQLRIVDDLPPSADVAQSFKGNVGESFVVVNTCDPDEFIERRNAGDEAGTRVAPLEQVTRVEHIMALASGQAEQDHPVCGDCLRTVVAEVQRQVTQAEEEHKVYQEAHARLLEELRGCTEEEAAALEVEIESMEAEEQRLSAELTAYDREEATLREELEGQRRQEEQLQREEEEFWLSVAEYQLDLEEIEEERAATQNAIRYATSELSRLKRTNVLNYMFHISQEGQFGTINGFRMGRLPPDKDVPWAEINAAWGQACLLLDSLIRKCGVNLPQYRLLPRGSYSAIQVGGEVLELYSNEGGWGTQFFKKNRLDQAMSSFLGCLKEVTKFLQRDPSMRLPFKIEGDQVAGFSIRMGWQQDERWTKALKFMLTDLKWLIASVESRDMGGSASALPAARPAQ